MKRILSSWQGFVGFIAAGALVYFSAFFFRWIDPTAGVFDMGFLQRPILALAYLLFAEGSAWLTFQIAFPTLDKWLDLGGFSNGFRESSNWEKMAACTGLFTLFLVAYLVCLWLVPMGASS